MRITRKTGLMAGTALAVAGLIAPAATAAEDYDAVTLADYQENQKALIGKFNTGPIPGYPQGVKVIYEVAVDQLPYRNGSDHKAWFIPESSKSQIVYVQDLATGQGITNSAPSIRVFDLPWQGAGSYSFDDADVAGFTASWQLGYSDYSGTFDMQWKRGGPGAKVRSDADFPRSITSKTRTGTFDYDGTTYTVTVEVDRVDFRNGTTHKEDVVPESHKVSVTPEFPGAIKTEFSGPGLETFGADETIQGTWKVGYGSTAPSGSFTL
jgi:hypothetical protein